VNMGASFPRIELIRHPGSGSPGFGLCGSPPRLPPAGKRTCSAFD